MIHKAALALAAVVATIALTVALVLAGFAPGSTPQGTASLATVAQPAEPSPTVQVDTIYVKPAPSPATIQIVRPAQGGGEHEGGEGGSDD